PDSNADTALPPVDNFAKKRFLGFFCTALRQKNGQNPHFQGVLCGFLLAGTGESVMNRCVTARRG
ncbi:MAG TPA: hypothetical protein PLX33_03130, partial [Alphaproteobacteria bacterium]|nr:hypothetical protein [Alphaproteobacteria bacterium]